MKRTMIAAVVMLFTGCATTLHEFRETATEVGVVKSTAMPSDMAKCIVAQAPVKSLDTMAVTTAPSGRETEVLIYYSGGVLAFATITPAGTGSIATVKVRPFLIGSMRERMLQVVNGC